MRIIPENAEKVVEGDLTAYFFYNPALNYFWLKIFRGNRSIKPAVFYHFKTEAKRAEYWAGYKAGHQEQVNEKLAHKAAKKAATEAAATKCKVGDIFQCSWGYDQTNVDYYEVVEVKGLTIKVREIGQMRVATESMSGRCTPIPGKFIGSEMTKRLQANKDGRVYFRVNSFSTAGLVEPKVVDGEKVYPSSYFSNYA